MGSEMCIRDSHGAVLAGARRVLRDRYGIAHATLQVEGAGSDGCHDLSW